MLSTGKDWRVDIAGLGRAWGMGQSLVNHQELCMPAIRLENPVFFSPLHSISCMDTVSSFLLLSGIETLLFLHLVEHKGTNKDSTEGGL